MDETAIGSVFAALGLAGAAGLNAPLPLFASALLARLDLVELAEPFDRLSDDAGLVVLGVLFVVDLVGDKVPSVDHVLHGIGTVTSPAAGAVLFVGETGVDTDVPSAAALVSGALLAGSVHLTRAAVRPVSTVTTLGFGNPVLSAIEDAMSASLTAAAFVFPLLALLLLMGLIAAAIALWRARPKGRRGREPL